MKVLYYIKTTLKGLLANGVVTIIYLIGFPIFIAAFMGFIQNLDGENPIQLKPLKVEIIDQDNSEMSRNLTQWIKSDEVGKVVKIVEKEPEVQLVINKGYEDNIINLKPGNITIDKRTDGRKLSVDNFKSILNQYHKDLYVSIKGGDVEKINSINSNTIIKGVTIDNPKNSNAYTKTAGSMLGFVVVMLMFSYVQGGYMETSINLDNRIKSTPITKLQYLLYDTGALLIYSTIIIFAYVLFFRIAGIAFKGNIFELLLLVILGAGIAVAIAKFVTTIFGAKYGRTVGTVLFILPLVGGELFMGKGNKLTFLTPTHYLNNIFTVYNLNGNLQGCWKWILMLLAIIVICFSLAVIKTVISRRRNICA